jgi:putative spermidine/putrescine transport system permease protein
MYQQVSVSNNFVSASVIAFILIVMSFAANILLKRVATARNREVAGQRAAQGAAA